MAGQQRITGIFPSIGPIAKDCNNTTNATCNIPVKDGCVPRFYPERCNYPVSATQMNAVVSELSEVIKEAGIEYDCSRLDNLAQAISKIVLDKIYGCFEYEFPRIGDDICKINYLVQVVDQNGCRRIAQYSTGSTYIAAANDAELWQGSIGQLPTNDVYTARSLWHAVDKSSVDEQKLLKSRVWKCEFSLKCASDVELVSGGHITPDISRGVVCGTLVTRIDGILNNHRDGTLDRLGLISSSINHFDLTGQTHLNAGNHIIEGFIVPNEDSDMETFRVPIIGDQYGVSVGAFLQNIEVRLATK